MLKNTKKGFTLLELIVVLLVLGILAAIAVPVYTQVKQESTKRVATTIAQGLARDANALSAIIAGGVTVTDHVDTAATETSFPTGVTYNSGTDTVAVVSGSYTCSITVTYSGGQAVVADTTC